MNKLLPLLAIIAFVSTSSAEFYSKKNFSYNKIDGEFSNLLTVDIYTPTIGENFPVVVFVHGGGWTTGDKNNRTHINKRDFFIEHGFIFVSINYRLAPETAFPVYPQDVAQAVAFVFNWIGKFKGDNNKIILMGHSAGAHLASLVATDDQYLNHYNYSPNDIKAVVLLDGAGYDIPAVVEYQLKNNPSAVETYRNAFGSNGSLWHDASPINHVSESTPAHILFYVDTRRVSYLMSTAFHETLTLFNTSELKAVASSSHYNINNDFGAEQDSVSEQALVFILQHITIGTL